MTSVLEESPPYPKEKTIDKQKYTEKKESLIEAKTPYFVVDHWEIRKKEVIDIFIWKYFKEF